MTFMLRGMDRLLPAGPPDEILGLEVATVTDFTNGVAMVHKLADPPEVEIQILTYFIPPVVGQRVWLLATKGQRIIVGRQGGTPALAPEIGDAVDLNTYIVPGEYVQSTAAEATAGTNYPEDKAGMLRVTAAEFISAGQTYPMIWQEYHPYGANTDRFWKRGYYYGTSWSAWTRYPGLDVISGTVAAKTWYHKEPNGTLTCRAFHTFPSNANTNQSTTWAFPVAFVGEDPQVTWTADTLVPQNSSLSVSSLGLTSVNLQFFRTTAASTGTWWTARGRWE